MASEPVLVVAAFWSDAPTHSIHSMALPGMIAGSGQVVRFTAEQAEQPGLREGLSRMLLKAPAQYLPAHDRGARS